METSSQLYASLADAVLELRRAVRDRVLLATSLVHPRHSVPPEHLRLLEEESKQAPVNVPGIFTCLLKTSIGLFSAVYDALLLLFCSIIFIGDRYKYGKPDILIKSWVPGREGLSKASDFYFGPLRDLLAENNVRALFLVGDAKSDDGSLSAKLKVGWTALLFAGACVGNPNKLRFPEFLLIPWWAPLLSVLQQFGCALRLRRLARQSSGLLRRVAAMAVLDVLRPYTTKNHMFYWIAKRAVQTWRPRSVVTLFEGQPWEKVFWKGAKAADSAVKLAGYQHTVLLPHCLALLNPQSVEGDIAAPEIVLCTGEGTRQRMDAGFRPFQSNLLVLGSHRRPAQAPEPTAPRPAKKRVLVLPEGILKEMVLLFDLAMDLAARLPDHEFVFRCHPVLPYEKAAPFLKRKKDEFQNIHLSTRPAIHDDFVECSALVYRGSSAAIYSVLDGVKPIYWAGEPGPVVDPLYLIAKWKEHAGAPEEFERILNVFRGSDGASLRPDWAAACRDVDAMVEPMTADSVGKFARFLL